jgi:hypothetical protein
MKVTGGCHCGHITYEAEVDPMTVRVCHCTDCQKADGHSVPHQHRQPTGNVPAEDWDTEGLHQDR